MSSRRFASAVCLLLAFMPLCAETATTHEAVPYGPAEFPPWQQDLRRAEIISFGALPFVTFFSSIYYDLYRYYSHDKEEGYLPWPFKKAESAVPLSEDEQKRILAYSAGISVGVAVFDFGYRAFRREMRIRKAEREIREKGNDIEIEPIPSESGAESD